MDRSGQETIVSKGIYHGLPELPSIPNGLTAIVNGANGISGAHMVTTYRTRQCRRRWTNIAQVRMLGENPERWSKIYALSRRPPSGTWPKTVQHIPLDFLKSPEDISKVLRDNNIKPDYIFFFSYVLITDDNGALQWGDQRLVDKNSTPIVF